MTLDDAIVAFGQLASGDFDYLELGVRDYERLVIKPEQSEAQI